jgi:putative ABC transport system permease protein
MKGTQPPDPPAAAAWLIRRLVPGTYGEELTAELADEFARRLAAGGIPGATAQLWYWSQALSPNLIRLRRDLRGRRACTGRRAPRGDFIVTDLRDALRALRKSPAYAFTVVVTFALAVGANVAVFSVVNGVLLRPLPYPAPEELITIKRVSTQAGAVDGAVSFPDFRDWRRETTALSGLAAYRRVIEKYFGAEEAEEWLGVETTPSLFAVLGVAPLLGRTLQPGVDPVIGGAGVVLSHDLWQRRFHGDSAVVGRAVRFENGTKTVIGIMPPGFYFPTHREQYWTTFRGVGWLENRGSWGLYAIGRLARGARLTNAQRELSALAERTDRLPDSPAEAAGVYLETRHDTYVGDTKKLLALLTGAVTLVLAVACANITNLGLTRAAAREREFAIRAAVGAGCVRLMRQLLAENLALALLGAAAGVAVAYAALPSLLATVPSSFPRRDEITVDTAALLFAAAAAVICGVVFGLAPALRAAAPAGSAHEGMRTRGAGRGAGPRGHATLKVLAVSQIALSQVLVVGAALLLHSFVRLSAVRPGFDTDHTLTMRIVMPHDAYGAPEQVAGFHRTVEQQVRALPGIASTGLTSAVPFGGSDLRVSYWLRGDAPAEKYPAHVEAISEDYLETMGIPLRAGRLFQPEDGPDVALINQRLADLHWAGTSPIGRRLHLPSRSKLASAASYSPDPDLSPLADEPGVTVIGVAETVLKRGLTDEEPSVIYLPIGSQLSGRYSFVTGRWIYLAVRSSGEPEAMAAGVRREIRAIDPYVVVTDIRSTAGLVADSVAEPRFRTVLIGSFATIALLVALVGVYGVMGFVVGERTQEIGVRMALGADASGILHQVLWRGAGLVGAGLALGTVVAFATSRVLSGMLFSLSVTDPATIAAVTALLAAAALGACYRPARRASRVDPMDAMRQD